MSLPAYEKLYHVTIKCKTSWRTYNACLRHYTKCNDGINVGLLHNEGLHNENDDNHFINNVFLGFEIGVLDWGYELNPSLISLKSITLMSSTNALNY